MNNIREVFRFGWPYLQRYWKRLTLGILFGVLFGVFSGSFIWATRTLTERLSFSKSEKHVYYQWTENRGQPQVPLQAAENHKKVSKIPSAFERQFAPLKEKLAAIKKGTDEFIDPWLPKAGLELDWRMVLGGLLFLPLLVSIRSIADYLNSYCLGWVSERVINDLRCDVLAKLNSLSLDYFNRSTTGDMLTRVNVDTGNLHKALKAGAEDLVKQSVSVVSVLFWLCLIDWKLTMFALLFLPACMFPLIVLGKKARRASREGRRASVSQNSLLIELLSNVRVIKAFNLESIQIKRYREFSKQLVHHGMKGVQAKEMVNPAIEIISMLGLGALIVYIFWSHQTVHDLVGFLTGLMLFFLPIKKLAGIHILFEQANAGIERLADILKEKPTVKEPVSPLAIKEFKSALVLDNVSFSYGDELVLRDLNLKIPRGFKLGVAGESGSGKSTLVNLLFRFYDPTSGAIKFDGLNLRDVSLTDLRQQMALVSQEIALFDASVAENIECGKMGASREEIEAAARSAFAHDFISQLPQGYDTRIGERGVRLSGGQRQRIAIARAFIRNAPVLVLDEATASLDSQSEAEVQAAIEKLEENRTVICVAHRLSTLAQMDAILVLSAGRVIEQGTFAELLKKGGTFANMAGRQGIFSRNFAEGAAR
jgi:subfamily B ATP-binding cassette protein MsbA